MIDGEMDIYDMYDNAEKLSRRKKLIIVPTTCGTGSEVTNLSIINLQRIGIKKGLARECMYPDCAILIPGLIRTLPYGIFAASSIDALIHALEGFLNPKATSYSDLFAKEAIRLIVKVYCDIQANGKDSYRSYGAQFLRASNYAGIAFGNSGYQSNVISELDKLLEYILPKKKMSEYGAGQGDIASFAALTCRTYSSKGCRRN